MTFDAMRRRFLEVVTGASVFAGVSWFAKGAKSMGEVPRRRLGHTGEMVSMVGLGGYHLVRPDLEEAESIRIVRTAIDNGINFLDNCWDYNGGQSEIRMGKALRDGYRQKVFLMTKIDGRERRSPRSRSTNRSAGLQTDTIDLMQFHEVIRLDDPDRIFAARRRHRSRAAAPRRPARFATSALPATRIPHIHLKMLDTAFQHGFTFDAVQMPLNVMDMHFHSFAQKVRAGAGGARHRRAGNEVDGRWRHSCRARPSPPSNACITP